MRTPRFAGAGSSSQTTTSVTAGAVKQATSVVAMILTNCRKSPVRDWVIRRRVIGRMGGAGVRVIGRTGDGSESHSGATERG